MSDKTVRTGRMIVLDVASWLRGEEDSASIPWRRLQEKLLPMLQGAKVCVMVTPPQRELIPDSFDAQVEILLDDGADGRVARREAIEHLAGQRALIVSGWASWPYERWLPARPDPDAPTGLRFTPADGLQRYLKEGMIQALPEVEYPLHALLKANDLDERNEVSPAFDDIMVLMHLPTSPFELYERMATLCDQKQVVNLDRYLRAKLRELVLFDGMDEDAIDEAIERRQLSMRVRHRWAQELEIVATASMEEQRAADRDAVEAVLGFPPKPMAQEDAQARLDVLPFTEEHTTLAYQVDGEIHILNPDPEHEDDLGALPRVYLHKKEERPLPLHHMLDELSSWTLDHYRKDPHLDGLIQRLTHKLSDERIYKYARAYIGYLGFPPPSPLPAPIADWQPALQQILSIDPPAVSLRYQYPAPSNTMARHGHKIMELTGTEPNDSPLYSPMACVATPAAAVTLHRGRRYAQVHLSSVQLGYERDDIFSPSDEFDGPSTEELERQGPLQRKALQQIASARGPRQGHDLYVEYPFRHAGLGEAYVVFPKIRRSEGSVVSSDQHEFLKFYQLNLALKKLSDKLSRNPEGKISHKLAAKLMPQIQEIFEPLQRQYVYFTLREQSPFPLKVPWRKLDRQIAAIWLSLRHALQYSEALRLHDDRVVLAISPGLFAECAIRPVADGVTLPVEASFYATPDDLAAQHPRRNGHPFERPGLVRIHPTSGQLHQGHYSMSGAMLPLPLQIIGCGYCAEIRFFTSPLQVDLASPALRHDLSLHHTADAENAAAPATEVQHYPKRDAD